MSERKEESSSKKASTFRNQGVLPRLPVPTLEETLNKFKKTLEALQTETEKQETAKIASDFLNSDGPELQKLLIQYDQDGRSSGKVGSYIEEFWNDSYLGPDASVVLNLNPFFLLEDGPDPKTAKDQLSRAAALTFASIKLASTLKDKSLPPDVFRNQPLCMDQFKALFGSCRIPRTDKDVVEVYPDSAHVAVLSRNQFYFFQALWPDGSVAVDEYDVARIVRAIDLDSSGRQSSVAGSPSVGVFTTLARPSWASIREDLVKYSVANENSLQIIDSALFVLVLDDYTPTDIHESASNMLHGTYKVTVDDNLVDSQVGTCCNRWYDKLQIIVCADGSAGINFEHSAIDGHTALRFVSDIFADTVVSFAQSITNAIYGKDALPSVIQAKKKPRTPKDSFDCSPKRLCFEFPASVEDALYHAETALGDEICSSETHVLEFKSFGKKLITTNKMSPDSFVQMAMLLAYYRLYGKIVCAYEPVLTKKFFHGRTEAMRTATPEASSFCKKFCCRQATTTEKLEALRKATVEHSRLVKEAGNGKGVDRHLYALFCIAQLNNKSANKFFHSKPWNLLNHTILSTSNCGNPSLRLFGFGPVAPDGFGVGYIIKDHGLQFSVSSKHRQTERYVTTLRRTLQDLANLMDHHDLVNVETHSNEQVALAPPDEYDAEASAYGGFWGEDTSEIDPRSAYFSRVIARESGMRSSDFSSFGVGLNE